MKTIVGKPSELIDKISLLKKALNDMEQTQLVWSIRKELLNYVKGRISRDEIVKILSQLDEEHDYIRTIY